MSRHTLILDAEGNGRLALRINRLVLSRLAGDSKIEGREGAYYCVGSHGVSVAGGLVGKVPLLQKRKKYDFLSREKVERVYAYHISDGHRLSRQSADETAEKYAGAVKGYLREYGVSGYPADVDEVFSALFAVDCFDLSREDAYKLLAYNPYFVRFTDAFEPSASI